MYATRASVTVPVGRDRSSVAHFLRTYIHIEFYVFYVCSDEGGRIGGRRWLGGISSRRN